MIRVTKFSVEFRVLRVSHAKVNKSSECRSIKSKSNSICGVTWFQNQLTGEFSVEFSPMFFQRRLNGYDSLLSICP